MTMKTVSVIVSVLLLCSAHALREAASPASVLVWGSTANNFTGTLAGAISLENGPTEQLSLLENFIGDPSKVAIDSKSKYVYWSDTRKSIFRMPRDSQVAEQVVHGDETTPLAAKLLGLAIDESAGVLYFNDYTSIRMLNLSHPLPVSVSDCSIVFQETGETQSVQVDPSNQWLYYSVWNATGNNSAIVRAKMSSSALPELLVSNLTRGSGIGLALPRLVFAPSLQKLFFGDTKGGGVVTVSPGQPPMSNRFFAGISFSSVAYDSVNDWVFLATPLGQLYRIGSDLSNPVQGMFSSTFPFLTDLVFDPIGPGPIIGHNFSALIAIRLVGGNNAHDEAFNGLDSILVSGTTAIEYAPLFKPTLTGSSFSADLQLFTGYFVYAPGHSYLSYASYLLTEPLQTQQPQTNTSGYIDRWARSVVIHADSVYFMNDTSLNEFYPETRTSSRLISSTPCNQGGGRVLAKTDTDVYYISAPFAKRNIQTGECQSIGSPGLQFNEDAGMDVGENAIFYLNQPHRQVPTVQRLDIATNVTVPIFNGSSAGMLKLYGLVMDTVRKRILVSGQSGSSTAAVVAIDYNGVPLKSWPIGSYLYNKGPSFDYDSVNDRVVIVDQDGDGVYITKLASNSTDLLPLSPFCCVPNEMIIDPSNPVLAGYLWYLECGKVSRIKFSDMTLPPEVMPFEVIFSGDSALDEMLNNRHYYSNLFFQPNSNYLFLLKAANVSSPTSTLYRYDLSKKSSPPKDLGTLPTQYITVDWTNQVLFQPLANARGFTFYNFDGSTPISATNKSFGASVWGTSVAIDHTRKKLYALSSSQILAFDYTSPSALPSTAPVVIDSTTDVLQSFKGRLKVDEAAGFLYYNLVDFMHSNVTLVRLNLTGAGYAKAQFPTGVEFDTFAVDPSTGSIYSRVQTLDVRECIYSATIPKSQAPISFSTVVICQQSVGDFLYESASNQLFWSGPYGYDPTLSATIGADNSISNRRRVMFPYPVTGVGAGPVRSKLGGAFFDSSSQLFTLYFGVPGSATAVAGRTMFEATLSLAGGPLVNTSTPTVFALDSAPGGAGTIAVSPDHQLFGYLVDSAAILYDINQQAPIQYQILPGPPVDWDIYWVPLSEPSNPSSYVIFAATTQNILFRIDSPTDIFSIFTAPAGYVLRSVRCDTGGKILYVGAAEDPNSCSVCRANVYRMTFDGADVELIATVNAVDSLQLQ